MNKLSKISKKSTTNSIQGIKVSGKKSSVLSSQSQTYAINRLLIKKALKKILKINPRRKLIMKNKLNYSIKYAKSLTSMKSKN